MLRLVTPTDTTHTTQVPRSSSPSSLGDDVWIAYAAALGLIFALFLEQLCNTQFCFLMGQLGLKLRGALSVMIFRKVAKRVEAEGREEREQEEREWSMGEMRCEQAVLRARKYLLLFSSSLT